VRRYLGTSRNNSDGVNRQAIISPTGVTKSVEGGKSYFGTPIEESREN
jgi:hypothetical protein